MAETTTLSQTETIEHLDYTPPCESLECQPNPDPAKYMVRVVHECVAGGLQCERCLQLTKAFCRANPVIECSRCEQLIVVVVSAIPIGGPAS